MTVFLVSPLSSPLADMKPVEAFGALEIINQRFIYGDEIVNEAMPVQFCINLANAATAFNPDRDYLMLGGDHLQFVALSTMLAVEHGHFRVLRWDKHARGYFSVMVQG